MKSIVAVAFSCGLAATALPALGASDDVNARTGIDAPAERSASPGKGEPDSEVRVPAQHKDPESRGEPPVQSSTGSSAETSARGGTDLGFEAEKEDEEIRKKLHKSRRR